MPRCQSTYYIRFDGTGSSQSKADTDLTYNPSTNTLTAGTYDTSSDERIKKNINPIDDALEILSELNGVKFEWKENGLPSGCHRSGC